MRPIPPVGPNQLAEYGRSQRKYLELKKKIKLCQNRGGPTLSQTWGQLMISGYMQDSCTFSVCRFPVGGRGPPRFGYAFESHVSHKRSPIFSSLQVVFPIWRVTFTSN